MKKFVSIPKAPGSFLTLFAVFYLLFFISITLVSKFAPLTNQSAQLLNTVSSLIQFPLLLVILLAFTPDKNIHIQIKVILGTLLAISAISLAAKGIEEDTLRYIVFVGALPLFVYSSLLFVRQVKKNVYDGDPAGDATMLSGIVFAAGSFLVLLILNRIDPQKHAADFRSLLGLITLISALLMAVGLLISFEWGKTPLSKTYVSPSKAGMAQWENFSLANTPDLMKNSVSDISKFYSEL